MDINLALLHEHMVDKRGDLVTTSVTLIDIHDISRSCTTYGVTNFFVSHPSPAIRSLARTLKTHWNEGFGATYNPNRKEALDHAHIVESLDEAIEKIDLRCNALPLVVATSARNGPDRISFTEMKRVINETNRPFLFIFGTGWGMSDQLMSRADLILEPICGPTEYNHLSVRSACAIILDRLFGK